MKWILIILAVSALGCATKKSDSKDLRTTGINAYFEVDATQSGVICKAHFSLEGDSSNLIELSAGDTVTCNDLPMTKSGNYYYAYPGIQVGATYTVVFTRSGEAPYSSTVVLPDAPVVTAPAASAQITKGQALTVNWNASSVTTEEAVVSLTATNHFTYSVTDYAPEAGTVTFGSSQTTVSPPESGTWSGVVSVKRNRTGSMASNLLGSITASYTSSVSVSLKD